MKRNNKLFWIVLCGIIVFILFNSLQNVNLPGNRLSEPIEKNTYVLPRILLESDWLFSHLKGNDFLIIDSRSEEEYLKGHIPGAVNFPAAKTFDPQRDFKMPIVPQVEKMLSAVGVDMKKAVIIYDQQSFLEATRVFVFLEVHGHKQVALLNGGLDKWMLENKPVLTNKVKVEKSNFVANINPQRLATKLTVKMAMKNPYTALIDARDQDDYLGISNQYERNGHIPTAKNIIWKKNLKIKNETYLLKSKEELNEIYKDFVDKKQFVTYCNRGKEGAVSYFSLRTLKKDVSAYDGSFEEWSKDINLPIITLGSKND